MAPRSVRLPLWLQRVGWLVLIWAASVAGLGAAAWLLRLLMAGAGFHR
ncbi:DUF2474 domain-containing protein [Cupriavidus pinatubonensis]|uniref:DUF2474 domain-containing protein n=1 Tax=Cupriavidus pinatubonensis TaxID=248026 RepID=A0ABN7YY04_9BURK|nr:DUF2474 domain-containing protein [Cupriavidus pinatubonensis]CAG9176577.1 hypothetical protein LMG23994_03450 [Cupriavidus pinatubonensis]